jgi:hypothetical protein
MKRRFYSETECPIKKKMAETNCIPNKCEALSVKRGLEFLLEIESHSKKRKLESNYKPHENASTQRSLNSDDESVTFKQVKIACSDAGKQKSHTVTGMHLFQVSRFTSRV